MKVSQIFAQGGGYGCGGGYGDSCGQVVFDDYRYQRTCYSCRYGGERYCYHFNYDYCDYHSKSHGGGLGFFG